MGWALAYEFWESGVQWLRADLQQSFKPLPEMRALFADFIEGDSYRARWAVRGLSVTRTENFESLRRRSLGRVVDPFRVCDIGADLRKYGAMLVPLRLRVAKLVDVREQQRLEFVRLDVWDEALWTASNARDNVPMQQMLDVLSTL